MTLKFIIKTVLLLTIALLLVSGAGLAADPKVQQAPDFTLEDMQGKKVSLSDFRGKIVVMNFWATWCPPCIEEMPSMEKLHQRFKGEDFVLLAINAEENGRAAVEKFLKKKSFTFPILLDEDAVVQQLFNIYRLPETLIINRNGEIVTKVLGGRDWMDSEILRVLDFMVKG